jgi:hypothetical protein
MSTHPSINKIKAYEGQQPAFAAITNRWLGRVRSSCVLAAASPLGRASAMTLATPAEAIGRKSHAYLETASDTLLCRRLAFGDG